MIDEDDSRAVPPGARREHRRAAVTAPRSDEMRTARRRLESLLVPPPNGRGGEPKVPPSMAGRRSRQRARAISRARAGREAGAPGARQPARPLSIAHRAAGDEGMVAQHKWGGEGRH